MDLSSILGTFLSKETVEGVSQKTGASTSDVTSVLSSALPQLLGGAKQQAENSSTSAGFASALNQHAGSDTSSISSFLSGVDLLDGEKIVGHLLGSNGSSQVASQTGVSTSTTSSIMSSAAPLLMSILGKESQKEEAQTNSSGGISGMISGLMGGNTDVSGVLGGIFGGKNSKVSGSANGLPGNLFPAADKKAPVNSGKTAAKGTIADGTKINGGTVSSSGKAGFQTNNTTKPTGTIAKKEINK